jgi:ABC-type Fe3+ transport system substrate-binding protein
MKFSSRSFSRRAFLGASLFLMAVGGCGGQKTSSPTSGASTGADDNTLVIISPHGRETQSEFERAFKAKHPDVKFKWIDQGGSSDDLSFVLSRFKSVGDKNGIDIDVFFGGGMESFLELESHQLLQPLTSSYGVPQNLNGVPLRGKNNVWIGAALSGFGLLYNKEIMARDALPVPRLWADVGNAKLRNRIALADPRHSGSAHVAYEIVLQSSKGWDKGWQNLTAMAANARAFSPSSSGLLDDVSSGEAVVAPAIDFFAASRVERAGGKLGYIEPEGQRVVTPDPIGVLRGAPHDKLAREFVAFVMSSAGQKLWMLPKGTSGGPHDNTLYRLAAVPAVYAEVKEARTNPFVGRNDFIYNADKGAARRRLVDDLIGAVLIDNLAALQKRAASTRDAASLAFVPVSEAQAAELSKKWGDTTFRNTTVAAWKEAARKHFSAG